MRFKIGDKAVYPAHGVAEITGVEAREVGGHKMDCYVLNILSSGATVMVPVSASGRAGMRVLSSDQEIEEVFSLMSNPIRSTQKTWNKRYREFHDKLKTGSVSEIAEVFRDLWNLQTTKDLSYGEKQMLEKSRNMVVSEISAARNQTEKQVTAHLQSIMTTTEADS
ncbi:MAG: CarD family transcriptional regulator [Deltaproteobacteria bacterium]|nr:CarD family transcriptional regulator [Deltaproteobacteria bacterium]